MPNEQSSNQDQALAYDMLKDSKFCLTGIVRAATESTNPQLRQFINTSLGEVLQEHFQLSELMVARGWYKPMNIRQQIQEDLNLAKQVITNQQMS